MEHDREAPMRVTSDQCVKFLFVQIDLRMWYTKEEKMQYKQYNLSVLCTYNHQRFFTVLKSVLLLLYFIYLVTFYCLFHIWHLTILGYPSFLSGKQTGAAWILHYLTTWSDWTAVFYNNNNNNNNTNNNNRLKFF